MAWANSSEAGWLWVATSELRAAGHPFYARLNRAWNPRASTLSWRRGAAGSTLGRWVAELGAGRYFRLLLVGYYEGLDSERGMAWRATDSLAVRSFLGLGLEEQETDH